MYLILCIYSIFRDVASIVVDKSINPENSRPYTISMIQNAMRQIHFSANTSKSSKSQVIVNHIMCIIYYYIHLL